MSGYRETGVASREELAARFPPRERLLRGPCAIIECLEEIPCNPCEESCPFDAITIGEEITNPPRLDFDLCTGCGVCAGVCPGLAIFIADLSPGGGRARLTLPHELLPVPRKGDTVTVLSRSGETLGTAPVLRAIKVRTTWLITIEVPEEWVWLARAIRAG